MNSNEHNFWREFLSDAAVVESQLTKETEYFTQQIVQPLLRVRGGARGSVGRRREKEVEERKKVKREGEKAVHELEEEFSRTWRQVEAVGVKKEEEVEHNFQ